MGSETDPIGFARCMWPDGFSRLHGDPCWFYAEQEEILRSVVENRRTIVPASNKMGKDFVAGFVVPWFFLTRHPCRIITTSAKEDHLRVLWGEIGGFIASCSFALDVRKGGNLLINHQEIRKLVNGAICPKSYVRGMVASDDSMAAMGGHHIASSDGIPRTLFVVDEASSVKDAYIDMASPWADRMLIIGNTWDCDNFWKRAVKEGTRLIDGRVYQRVIHLTAEDSPNIRLARSQLAAGIRPTNEILVPGVKSWDLYREEQEARANDPEWLAVSHRAEFYEGAEVKLFPLVWLDRAHDLPQNDPSVRARRTARAIGIDPGEGSANTSMTAVDELGVIDLSSRRTPDTSIIDGEVIAFGQRHGCSPENWLFDRGGGGKQIADRLRSKGFPVRTVAFGEGILADIRRGIVKQNYATRVEVREDRYTYINRRAEMYGEASQLLDPGINPDGFAIPGPRESKAFAELHRQLLGIPKRYDGEGRLWLPPKNKKDPNSSTQTLIEILGGSPDEADSLVLAIHGMLHKAPISRAGSFIKNA
jgi:hypothetical protein